MLIVSRGYYSLTYLFSCHSLISHQDGAIDRAALAEVCFLVVSNIWDSAIN